MLRINRNSWHYRLWSVGRPSNHKPRNLCRYFWYCVFVSVLGLVISGLAFGGLVGLIYLIATNPTEFAIGTGMLILIVGVAAGSVWMIQKMIARKREREEERRRRIREGLEPPPVPKPPKEPSVLLAFLKAKKERYCPLIQVVDD